jgi:hypothetical protein
MSTWDALAHIPGNIQNHDTGDVADDTYHMYPEDVQVRLKVEGLARCCILKPLWMNARGLTGWCHTLATQGPIHPIGAYLRPRWKPQAHNGMNMCDLTKRGGGDGGGVQLMKAHGIKAYRFSINWPRILPQGIVDDDHPVSAVLAHEPNLGGGGYVWCRLSMPSLRLLPSGMPSIRHGHYATSPSPHHRPTPSRLPSPPSLQPNPEGLAYYNNLINALVDNGITPYVTIHHGEMPLALAMYPRSSQPYLEDSFPEVRKPLQSRGVAFACVGDMGRCLRVGEWARPCHALCRGSYAVLVEIRKAPWPCMSSWLCPVR